MKYILISFLIFVLSVNLSAQDNPDKLKNLKSVILETEVTVEKHIDLKLTKGNKSKALSVLLSIFLPGAGHFYADRMDVGKYFLTAEGALWLGLVGMDMYGNALRNDARSYAVVHSGLNKEGKSDDYFVDVGNYNNIYEYNNYKLSIGEYDKLYDPNSHFWNWDNLSNRLNYDKQRTKSERMYDNRKIFTTGLIINRLASAISAFIITQTDGKVKMSSEFIGNHNGEIDGFEINFVKTF
ncbi:MAG: hypothetical protein JW917_01295 [Ignavibacteria bacterium]|nr:hypothetical protein [Ignavibacteria bacterium]